MAPSDATEENRNIGAQLQSILYTTAQKGVGKFTSCRTFSAHKLFHSEPFLDYLYELRHLLSALCSDVRKKIIIIHVDRRTDAILNIVFWLYLGAILADQREIRKGDEESHANAGHVTKTAIFQN